MLIRMNLRMRTVLTLKLDDVIQSVYYALYSNMYDEKVTELKKDMKIKVY